MTKAIKGAGGFFGGRPKPPYRAPDTLESKQFATVLDLLSEGEIEGFATPSKKGIARSASHYLTSALSDVFLDDTSILNINKESDDYLTRVQNTSNSDFNYSDVTFRARYGISSQTPLQNIENEGSEGQNEITAQGGLSCTQASGGRVLTITDSNPRTIEVNGETVQNPARVDAVKLVAVPFEQMPLAAKKLFFKETVVALSSCRPLPTALCLVSSCVCIALVTPSV